MALEIIPNQPVIFQPQGFDSSCTCCEQSQDHCMLLQDGDDLYAQVKMNSCGDELICGQITLGPELVTNGTFEGSAAGWTLGTNWAYNANAIRSTGSTIGETASQSIPSLTVGRTYRVSYSVSNYVSGDVTVVLGATSGTTQTANGTFTEDIVVASGTTLLFSRVSIDFSGDIDDVSVKELFPCWTPVDVDPEAEYALTDEQVCINGTLSFVSNVAGAVTGLGSRYVLTFTISNYVSGEVDILMGSGNVAGGDFASNGQKFFYNSFITDTDLAFIFTDFIGCISDISIKLLFAPDFYFVNTETGEIIPLGSTFTTFVEDRAILHIEMDGETLISYGCWKICMVSRCGTTGDELVQNGDFQAGQANWSFGGGWAVDHGVAIFTDTGVSGLLSQTFESEAQACVAVEVINVTDGGQLQMQLIHGVTTVANLIITEPGVYTLCGLITKIQFAALGGNGNTYAIDNVSAFEIEDCDECESFCSNCIKYQSSFPCDFKLIESYENTNGAWGFVWNDSAGNNVFKLSHRVKATLNNARYPEEAVPYTFSTGTTNDTFAQSEKTQQLFIEQEDERVHDVIRLQKRSRHLFITDVNGAAEYWAEVGDYNPDWTEPAGSCVAPARFRVKKKNATLYNNLCG